jgi:hypothetical protein
MGEWVGNVRSHWHISQILRICLVMMGSMPLHGCDPKDPKGHTGAGSGTGDGHSTGNGSGTGSGSGTGTGNGTDAGTGAGGLEHFAAWDGVSPATAAFVTQLPKAWAGEPADLDGDGVAEVTSVALPAGGRRWESNPGHAGHPEWFVEKDRAGKTTIGLDTVAPTGFDVIEVFDPGTRTRIETIDRDGSGKPEQRRTLRYDPTFSTVEILYEADAQETGAWVEVRHETAPAAWDQPGAASSAAACDGTSDFPTLYPYWALNRSPDTVPGAPGIRILSGNGATYDCNAAESSKVQAAFNCALTRARSCLPSSNARLAKKISASAVAGLGSLYVGCGNSCPGKNATTEGPVMNLSRSAIGSPNADDLCSLVMHELFHWAGEPGGSAHDAGASDAVYSCARYCAHCSHFGKGGTASSNVDCARCGETEAEKRLCGVQAMATSLPCPAKDLCHAGLGGNFNCTQCEGVKDADCEGNPFSTSTSTFSCCRSCPHSGDKNDKPCPGAPKPSLLSCGTKAPQC